MAVTNIAFKWLSILEKEFDVAFVNLKITIEKKDLVSTDLVYAQKQLSTLNSCFSQLVHKSQTIFEVNAKSEAELVNLRTELLEARTQYDGIKEELHAVLLKHSETTPKHVSEVNMGYDVQPVQPVQRCLEFDSEQSSPNLPDKGKDGNSVELFSLQNQVTLLQHENTSLRNTIVALQSEVSGAKLTAKYLDKELAGRIQQLQLLGREMRGEEKDKLWRQLEAEILLQRHKTLIRTFRNKGSVDSFSAIPEPQTSSLQGIGEPRFVTIHKEKYEELGISITGGREHGVPILISEIEPDGLAASSRAVFIGDAILSVNRHNLREASHQEAVDVLTNLSGNVALELQYIATGDSDDDSLAEDIHGFKYRFFDDEVLNNSDEINIQPVYYGLQSNSDKSCALLSTPTAPRTPESMCASVCSASESPIDFSPKLQLDESLSQKEDSLSSGNNNNADHNQLDNIERQISVKLHQTVNEPSIDPSLENSKTTITIYIGPEGSDSSSPSDTSDTIKEREELEKYSPSYNKENIHVSPELEKHEECCKPNNEPPSFLYSDSSDVSPPLPILPSTEHKNPFAKTILSISVEPFKETSFAQGDVFNIPEEIVESSNINLREISSHQIGYCFGKSDQTVLDQNIKDMKIDKNPKNTAYSADKEMEDGEEHLLESTSSSSIVPKSTSEGNMDSSSEDFGDPNFGTRV